ncbi:MAG: DUF4394 domain-containing protein [Tepidisphaeraceae bacterium]
MKSTQQPRPFDRAAAHFDSPSASSAAVMEPLEGRRLFSVAVELQSNAAGAHKLRVFDTATPATTQREINLIGVLPGERLVSLDVRPETGQLFAISRTRLYHIDVNAGNATPIGGPFAVAIDAGAQAIEMDFNPTVDRIRVVTDTDQNLRLNPQTGAVVDGNAGTAGVQPDTPLAYAAGDANALVNPAVAAIAYTGSQNGATTTTLYGIDAQANALVSIGGLDGTPSPNTGQLTTLFAFPGNVAPQTHLDIVTSNRGTVDAAFTIATLEGAAAPLLFGIDLATGQAATGLPLATPAAGFTIDDFALLPFQFDANGNAPVAFALTTRNELLAFFVNDPTNILRRAKIRGMDAGEQMIGIDFRPATGDLYGVTNLDRTYIINPRTGRTREIGSGIGVDLAGDRSAFGVDFNPVPDRLRVLSTADQNLRIHPDTGAAVDTDLVTTGIQVDGTLVYGAGDANEGTDPVVSGAAYTNSYPGTPVTTLYNIDTGLDVLVTQNPNVGTLTTVGPLGVNVVRRTGFDVYSPIGDDFAFAALQVDGQVRAGLYTINLTSGQAVRVGSIGGGRSIVGLALPIAP